MHTLFTGDFSLADLSSWTREQHTPDGYHDFVVRAGALVFLDAGNRLLPHVPVLDAFRLEATLGVPWVASDGRFSFQIGCDVDPARRQGACVELKSDGQVLSVRLSRAGQLLAEEAVTGVTLATLRAAERFTLTLERTAETVALDLAGQRVFSAPLERSPGVLALGRGAFIGELRCHALTIQTPEAPTETLLWDRLAIPFAPINGMDDPIRWVLSAWRIGSVIRLAVELAGGCVERPDLPWFPYHGRYIEELTAPYLRIEAPAAEPRELLLTDRTLTLCHQPQKHFYLLGPEEPAWPLRRTFFLPDFQIERAVLACGYRAYNARAINKHQAVTRAYETIYDLARGAVVFAGEALPPGTAGIELRSSDQKQLVRSIPADLPQRDAALQFARLNHYFAEGEGCSFQLSVRSRLGAASAELWADARLEDAFFAPQGDWQRLELRGAGPWAEPGVALLGSDPLALGALPAGVYHLRFRLWQGGHLLETRHRAFEVISATQSGPQASGLPVLFSMPTEIQGASTDYFDPWKADTVDVSHYIGLGASIMPHLAREKRLWELYRLYHRQWFLVLTSRTTPDWRIATNRDLIAHCDFIEVPHALREGCLIRLCCRIFYKGSILAALRDYAMARDFQVDAIQACFEAKCVLAPELFSELVETRFYDWLAFFRERYDRSVIAKRAELAEVSGTLRFGAGGPVSVYVSAYKTAHAVRYLTGTAPSEAIQDALDGFFIFEDYPHACRYSIHRGPLLLADIKLKYPRWRLAPEMYSPFGEPCPDAAVARAWPSVGMWGDDFPVNGSIKRVIEYVYGAVWHDGTGFRYWQEYFFHTRVWERARYEALLRLWGFVRRVRPLRPLRADALVSSEACCLAHPPCYDEYPGSGYDAVGDLFNTAEEAIPFTHEMGRIAGRTAGFVTDLDHLAALEPEAIDILVLPPLTAATAAHLSQIRRLHAGGVPLLAFEVVTGLEDLFGVRDVGPAAIRQMQVSAALVENPLRDLKVQSEFTTHRASQGRYESAGAAVLIEGERPVLLLHTTATGRAALFNLPPTVVRRQDQPHRVAFGRDSISPLINGAMQTLLRYLGRPEASTDAGKLLAFEDQAGDRHVIVMEDAHPLPARAIAPLVTLQWPGIAPERITCDRAFSVVSHTPQATELRLHLGPDEFAVISVRGAR